MAKKNLEQRLSGGLLFLDGAMGTQLIARGVEAGKCNEILNIESPDIILEIHRAYFNAGSDAVLTNTFGANEIALARHNLADKVEQINLAAVKVARRAAGKDKFVIGDIGPSGGFLQPLGSLEPQVLKSAFVKQAKALYDGGADGFIIETFTAVDEAKIAVEAVKSVCSLPIFVSFAFDPVGSTGSPQAGGDFKTVMGASAEMIVSEFSALGVSAIGFNCGTLIMEQYAALAEKFAKLLMGKSGVAVPATAKLLAEPNAGKPELIDGRAVYELSPEDFGVYMDKIYKAGARIIGGCCGTGPEHVKAMVRKIKDKK